MGVYFIIKKKKKLLFQSHIAEPFAAKIGDKKGRVLEALRSPVGCDQGLNEP